MLNKERFTAK